MSEWNKQIANALMGYAANDPSTGDVRNKLMDVVTNRATFFPAADYADGSTRWAWPGAIYEPAAAFGRMLQGDMSPQNALPVAGGIALGGISRAPVKVPPDRDLMMARRMMDGPPDSYPTVSSGALAREKSILSEMQAPDNWSEAGFYAGQNPYTGGMYTRSGENWLQSYGMLRDPSIARTNDTAPLNGRIPSIPSADVFPFRPRQE